LTTSHKSNYSIEEWITIFNLRGIKIKNIYSLPENKAHLSRKEEIMNWITSSNELPDFIIIDDDKSLNGLPKFVKNKLIQTNASIGLTIDLINEALEIIADKQLTIA
jgi:hypothetical protein